MSKPESTLLLESFLKDMTGRQYGMEELFDALYWFRAGWDANEARSRELQIENMRLKDEALTHVAGISAPRRHWTNEQREKYKATIARKNGKRTSKAKAKNGKGK